jgi:predicted RNA-binding protein with PIN domain
MTDISNMHGTSDAPSYDGERAILTGYAPVATIRSYPETLRAYTHGEGRISLSVGAYIPCHNQDEVINEIGYNPELDERNTANSVFCKAGAGYVVPWYEADALMHIGSSDGSENAVMEREAYKPPEKVVYTGSYEDDKELMAIFERTYGKIKVRKVNERVENSAPKETKERRTKEKPKGDRYVIIDGYNFIFANEELKNLADKEISVARDTVTRLMCDYCAFNKSKAIIVFDAYKRSEGEGSVERLGDVSVVYTKSAETADSYIEKTTYDMAREHTVRVVTSDFQEQLVILGAGGLRVSAKEFYKELCETAKEIRETIERSK